MTFDEVETLFHEFGHVLHNGIGKSKYTRFVGANCEWDFVEAPSQIMEHWVWKVECMKRISKQRKSFLNLCTFHHFKVIVLPSEEKDGIMQPVVIHVHPH